MKKLYTAPNPLVIGHIKNLLESGGIRCSVKNIYLAGAIGELPPIECWPELWVLDDRRYPEARRVLKRTLAPLRPAVRPWHCQKCRTDVDGQFSECWNCGGARPLFETTPRDKTC